MEDYKKVAIAVVSVVVLVGGIFLAIYLTQGGEGDMTDIPGNPSEVVPGLPGTGLVG